jgi:hypothetical protein
MSLGGGAAQHLEAQEGGSDVEASWAAASVVIR